jgi:hypothetical protein
VLNQKARFSADGKALGSLGRRYPKTALDCSPMSPTRVRVGGHLRYRRLGREPALGQELTLTTHHGVTSTPLLEGTARSWADAPTQSSRHAFPAFLQDPVYAANILRNCSWCVVALEQPQTASKREMGLEKCCPPTPQTLLPYLLDGRQVLCGSNLTTSTSELPTLAINFSLYAGLL